MESIEGNKIIAELLKPRYKVIAGWPEMEDDEDCQLGKILTDVDSSNLLNTDYLDKFPHLFKLLQWYEERPKEEMPEYVRWTNPGTKEIYYFKIEQWLSNSVGVYTANVLDPAGYFFIRDLTPATKEEYEIYTANNK